MTTPTWLFPFPLFSCGLGQRDLAFVMILLRYYQRKIMNLRPSLKHKNFKPQICALPHIFLQNNSPRIHHCLIFLQMSQMTLHCIAFVCMSDPSHPSTGWVPRRCSFNVFYSPWFTIHFKICKRHLFNGSLSPKPLKQ
jgi:hypothetical protein